MGPNTCSWLSSLTDALDRRICNRTHSCQSPAGARQAGKDWTLGGHKVDYCLSQKVASHCKLEFSIYILVGVIGCNVIKSAVMLWMVLRLRDVTFVTFGDALSNWLDEPDQYTQDRCLLSRIDATLRAKGPGPTAPTSLDRKTRCWRQAISVKRWVTTTYICALAILVVVILLGFALAQYSQTMAGSIFSLGFGSPDPRLMIGIYRFDSSKHRAVTALNLASSILLANAPQVVLSLIYLSYNALITGMHLAHEYSGYALRHKPLRVTTPCGQQRNTYWLQLPYKYGIPLIAISAILHWLVSRSLFLLRLEIYGKDGGIDLEVTGVGYSLPPILAVAIIGTCVMLGSIAMGGFKLQHSLMPVASSCSLALAAATHRPENDVDAAVLPVKWGEVANMGNDDVGHCCFTSQAVVDVIPGRKYA